MKLARFIVVVFMLCLSVSFAVDFTPPSGTFDISSAVPDVVITANTMTVKDGLATLTGNVKATRATDVLTCNKAIVSKEPSWMLASLTPHLFRRETLLEQKLIRELNLEAKNIFVNETLGTFSASDSVYLRIDENSWDLATTSWSVITSDEMLGFKDSERMIFSGNVRIIEQDTNGKGNRLDLIKSRNLAILSGRAYLETKEFDEKTGKKEMRILRGNKIIYNTETKQATSK